jgi:hypothetical protein
MSQIELYRPCVQYGLFGKVNVSCSLRWATKHALKYLPVAGGILYSIYMWISSTGLYGSAAIVNSDSPGPLQQQTALLPSASSLLCLFITAVPITKLFAGGGGDIGGHVLWGTTSYPRNPCCVFVKRGIWHSRLSLLQISKKSQIEWKKSLMSLVVIY